MRPEELVDILEVVCAFIERDGKILAVKCPSASKTGGYLAKPKLNHKLKPLARALVDRSGGRGFGVVYLFDVILHRDRCAEEKECR